MKKVYIDGEKTTVFSPKVVNNLTDGGTAKALSAEQGKTLKGLIDNIQAGSIDALTDTDISNKTDGDVLQYDSTSSKWKNKPTTFTEASSRTNIASGDSLSTIFGKIKKFFSDLKTVAFTGAYSDLTGQPTIPTVPTNVSAFTNDSGYITSAGSCNYASSAGYATSAGSALDTTKVAKAGDTMSGALHLTISGGAEYNSDLAIAGGVVYQDCMLQGSWWGGGESHNVDSAEPNTTHFGYPSHGLPSYGPFITICDKGHSNYRLQLQGSYTNGGDLYYRTENGDNSTWNSWKRALYEGIGGFNLAYGHINNSVNQYLYFRASGEDTYAVVLGVADNLWTFRPNWNAQVRLGSPSYKWGQIYSNSGVIDTSDRNAKKDIKELDEFARTFIMSLKPVSYKFIDGTSGRTHYGMIAQDIEDSFDDLGITAKDLGAFCKDQKYKEVEYDTENLDDKGEPIKAKKQEAIEGEYIYGLRYEEFISPMIKTIQLQQKEIEELKKRLDALEKVKE